MANKKIGPWFKLKGTCSDSIGGSTGLLWNLTGTLKNDCIPCKG